MKAMFRGTIQDKPTPSLFAEIVDLGLTGLLRVHSQSAARTIYFEDGAPVFAASDIPNQKLEHLLSERGMVSADLIDQARHTTSTPEEFSWWLVESGAIDRPTIEQAIRDLATEIVITTLECRKGEFVFYQDSELGLDVKLDWTPAECILAGARRAAADQSTAELIAPLDACIVPTRGIEYSIGASAKLSSTEAFVLSSVVEPIRVTDIAAAAGLPESETRAAVCVLLALGLLELAPEPAKTELPGVKEPEPQPGPSKTGQFARSRKPSQAASEEATSNVSPREVEVSSKAPVISQPQAPRGDTLTEVAEETSIEWITELVARKTATLRYADHYEVLGVQRIAPVGKITKAYEKTKEQFESMLATCADHEQLSSEIRTLLARVEEAYQTLRDTKKRSAYDRPSLGDSSRGPIRKSNSTKPAGERLTSGEEPGPGVGQRSSAIAPAETETKPEIPVDPLALAAEHYKKGRRRFDRSDFHTAVHLFREAAKLDPSKSRYHYYLGVSLATLAETRHTRHSHTHDVGSHVTCLLGGGLARNPGLRREAEQSMLKAAELDRQNPEIPLRLARLYRDAGMEKKAEHYFLQTLMLDSNNQAALRELGMSQPRPVDDSMSEVHVIEDEPPPPRRRSTSPLNAPRA